MRLLSNQNNPTILATINSIQASTTLFKVGTKNLQPHTKRQVYFSTLLLNATFQEGYLYWITLLDLILLQKYYLVLPSDYRLMLHALIQIEAN